MAGLTGLPESPRTCRTLIAKLMKGDAVGGISHAAVGDGVGGAYSFYGVNQRIGNNLEITNVNANGVTVHNDFPVYNYGPNGIPNMFYFFNVDGMFANNQKDVNLVFGTNDTGATILRPNKFNHLFLVDKGASVPPGYGIGTVLCAPTDSATMPVTVPSVICYIGYVETDTTVKTIYNPARMYRELGRTTNIEIEYLGDRAMNPGYLETLRPSLLNISTQPNPSLIVRGRFSLGSQVTLREIALFGNNGADLVAWAPVADTLITIGESIFVRWGLGF